MAFGQALRWPLVNLVNLVNFRYPFGHTPVLEVYKQWNGLLDSMEYWNGLLELHIFGVYTF